MTGYIYLIKNLINGKGYVGQTWGTVAKRFVEHKNNARRGVDFALYRAMREYGIENFSVLRIVSCESKDFLDELEKHFIRFFGTFSPTGHGYNMTEGGNNPGRTSGFQHTEEWKLNNSKIHTGMKRPARTVEWRINQIRAKTGKVTSAETKAKLSTALSGKKKPPRSDAYKANMSAAKKGQGKGKPWSTARRDAEKGIR